MHNPATLSHYNGMHAQHLTLTTKLWSETPWLPCLAKAVIAQKAGVGTGSLGGRGQNMASRAFKERQTDRLFSLRPPA